LHWLAGQVREHHVDLVLAAGDIYDRSLPAEEAVALLDGGLDAIRTAGAHVLLMARMSQTVQGHYLPARRLRPAPRCSYREANAVSPPGWRSPWEHRRLGTAPLGGPPATC